MKLHAYLFLICSFQFTSLSAQVKRLADPQRDFSSSAVLLGFIEAQDGAEASEIFSKWGVLFSGDGGTPRIREITQRFDIHILPPRLTALRNEPDSGSSANRALIINFKFPVRRVGFALGNGNENTFATMKAYNAAGNFLGTLTQEVQKNGPFTGIEVLANSGLSKVTIDYGGSERAEEISSLIFEYVSRPRFTTFLPQVGDGRLPAGSLQTTIVVMNLAASTAKTSVHLLDSDGQPLSLVFEDGTLASKLDFTLSAFQTQTFTTKGVITPGAAGYARIESNVPIKAAAIFRVLDLDAAVRSEAAIGDDAPRVVTVAAIERVRQKEMDTGIAIVNASTREAAIRIDLRSPTQISFSKLLKLPPGAHIAQFSAEMFTELATRDFEGTAVLSSSEPIAVTVLRTNRGLPTSSLPID